MQQFKDFLLGTILAFVVWSFIILSSIVVGSCIKGYRRGLTKA